MSIVIPGSLGLAKNILSPKSASGFETNDLQVLNNDGVENFIRFSKCIDVPTNNGWVRYQNAAASTPSGGGAGGTPSANLTFTRTTSGNLDTGFGNFLLTKAAVNMQGYGVSYQFTIPEKYKSIQLLFSFAHTSSANYAAGDIYYFIYDTTNLALISPATGVSIGTGTNITQNSFTFTNSVNYRIIFHVASTNALAYTFELDRIAIGPASLINLSATAPLSYNSGTSTLSIPKSTIAVDGYLAATDFTTFNNKVATTLTISTTAPLTGGGDLSANRTIAIPAATNAVNGYLTSTDWTTFNNKVATTRTISTTAPITGGGDLSADRTLAMAAATTSVNGYLTSTDWTTFNNKQAAITIGSLGSGNANGLALSAGSLVLHAATSTQPGAVSTTAQIFAGDKTFNGDILKPEISGNASFRSGVSYTGSASSPSNLQSCYATFGGSFGYLFIVTRNDTGDAALIFTIFSVSTIVKVSDPFGIVLTTDSGTGIYISKSANSGVITFKNRFGATVPISIQAITNTVSSIGAWA